MGRGRPPIGKQAMSTAERQRRHRARFRDTAPVAKPTRPAAAAAQELAQAKKGSAAEQFPTRIAELEAQLAQAKARITELQNELEETDERCEVLGERIAQLKRFQREAERLKRQLKNVPPPDIHNGMTVPERIQQHLLAAYDLMNHDLELSKDKRKKAKLDKIFTWLHHVVAEFNRWAGLKDSERAAPSKPTGARSGGQGPLSPSSAFSESAA
jgi:DNA repair exonuclease SbcCD ATPase subunit